MVIFEEEVLDVPVHGRLACPFSVVPCQVDACNFFARPVRGDIVVCEQGLEEMVCMAIIGVLDAQVVNDEDKTSDRQLWHQRPGVIAHW